MSADLLALTATRARTALDKKEFSAAELTEAYLAAAEATAALNAYTEITADRARAMAAESDRRIAAGEARLLEGIPIGVKDLFCTEGIATTAGSRILAGFVPQYESTVTANLWRDGAVMLGKLNCDEFAMGSDNRTSAAGPVLSPWKAMRDGAPDNADRVPGGSSGGSAASVAARSALLATGTDTGGSIRQPAAFCGITGVKPGYGRCSRRGIVAFASSLDQAGPLARDTADAALMLRSISGHDPLDSTSINAPPVDVTASLGDGIKGMRIGIPDEYTADGMDGEITGLWEAGRKWLEDAGAQCVPVSLPHTKYALPAYYIIAPAEASSNLARYDGVRYGNRIAPEGGTLDDMYCATRAAGFGEEVQRRILMGTYVLSAGYYDAYYIKAQKVRRLIADDFTAAFADVDLLLTPTTPGAAFAVGAEIDPITMYLNDVFTVPASLAGLPAMSVPAGVNGEGLPLGLQIIAPAMGEEAMFRCGRVLEMAAGFDAVPQMIAGGGNNKGGV